uniref:Putative secreted protein n=1 Tax=Ixodes ricinus TaxID=34613 RepID=A0A6B0TYF4_IXORI
MIRRQWLLFSLMKTSSRVQSCWTVSRLLRNRTSHLFQRMWASQPVLLIHLSQTRPRPQAEKVVLSPWLQVTR